MNCKLYSLLFVLFVPFFAFSVRAETTNFEELFDQRVKCVVVVECFIQNEVDREPALAIGVVFDDAGRIVLLDSALPSWLPPTRFRDFRVKSPGEDTEGRSATYLGQDFLTGYHFIQLDEGHDDFTPVSAFGQANAGRGELLWGIGVMGESWAYVPYFLSGRLSGVERLPWNIGFTDLPVATPGSAVFNNDGVFVGWAGAPVQREMILTSGGERRRVGLQEVRESSMFLTAKVFFEHMERVPSSPIGNPRPWLGVSGMQPLDREAAGFLGLKDRGSIVISDVIKEGPAEVAGLQSRDIVVAIDGEPLPKLKPDFVVPRDFERQILSRNIGDTIQLSVVRGSTPMVIDVTLATQPTPLKEAAREYFPELGLSIREFTLFDGIARRTLSATDSGVIVDFVKPNSPLNSAGLVPGDWIKEVDGQDIADFTEADTVFTGLEEDTEMSDFVVLVDRNGETKVLRVKRQ